MNLKLSHNKQMNEVILRKYVQGVINELTDVDVATGYDSSATGMGSGGASIFSLMKALGDPIADVLKTAKTEIKVLGSHLERNFMTVLTFLGGLIIPGMEANYAPIYERHREKVKSIREENKEVYAKTWGALKSNDATMFAFMAAPAAMIGGKLALAAPRKAKEMLSVLTGGSSDKVIDNGYKYLRDRVSDVKIGALGGTEDDKERARIFGKDKGNKKSQNDSRFLPVDLLLFEKNEEKQQKVDDEILAKAIQMALKDPDVISSMQQKSDEMKKDVMTATEETLKEILKKAQTFEHGFKDLNQAEEYFKKSKLPEAGKALAKLEELKKLPPDKIKVALQVMTKGIDEVSKRVATKEILEMKNDAIKKGGASDNNPFVKLCDSYMNKIKSL